MSCEIAETMKILITGANGLLGQKLVALLTNQPDIEVVATSRGDNRIACDLVNYTYRNMDITRAEQVNFIIDKEKPDVIIHTAALTNVDECELDHDKCWLLNVRAVEYLIEAAERQGCFFIQLSTDFIFSGERGPLCEEDQANPVNFYGQSKLEAEKMVMQSKLDYAIVRTILVYGITPNMSRSNIILWVKESLEQNKSIRVVDDQYRTPTLAEDLAIGCYLIAEKRAKGIFHISGKDRLTPYQIALQTAEFFNLDAGLITRTDSSEFKQPAMRPPETGFIIDKAAEVLGYSPHSFKEGIEILSEQLEKLNTNV